MGGTAGRGHDLVSPRQAGVGPRSSATVAPTKSFHVTENWLNLVGPGQVPLCQSWPRPFPSCPRAGSRPSAASPSSGTPIFQGHRQGE